MWASYKRLFNDKNVNSIICIAFKSHYEALNIPKTATHKEIKDAYYRLSMMYHPDKNKGSEEAAKNFRDITAAYEVLGNVRQKKLYDIGLNPDLKTSQYNPKRPFEAMNPSTTNARNKDRIFDDRFKTQYTSLLQQHYDFQESVALKKRNENLASNQHIYNVVSITVFISIFTIILMHDNLTAFLNKHDIIKKNMTDD